MSGSGRPETVRTWLPLAGCRLFGLFETAQHRYIAALDTAEIGQ